MNDTLIERLRKGLWDTQGEADALMEQAADALAAQEEKIAGLEQELAQIKAEYEVMATELIDLRGSFPSKRHQKLYDALAAALAGEKGTG